MTCRNIFLKTRPTLKKIFLFPLTLLCFTGMGRLVGNLIFLTKILKLDTHYTEKPAFSAHLS